MTLNTTRLLPHQKLRVWTICVELLTTIRDCKITDTVLKDHALRSAKSVCLNCAEGAGRSSRADKAKSFTIARAEAVEVAAAVELAILLGCIHEEHAAKIPGIVDNLVAMFTGLIR